MKTEPWVLIVGGKLELVLKAKALGLRVLHLQDREHIDHEQLGLADRIVITEFKQQDNLVALAHALHAVIPFQQVIALSEDTLVPAAAIRQALQLPGASVTTTYLLKNKPAMRQRLAAVNLSPVATAIGKTASDLHNFLQHCAGPIIAKPIDAAGSLGVFRIHDNAAAEQAYAQLEQQNLIPFIMEEYLAGIEISVETFSFNKHHIVMTITDKLVGTNFVETGHTMPSQLDLAQQTEIIELTKNFLDVMGVTDGPAHTEIKLTPKGARIIESHNRVGGDHINELIHTVFGMDMKQMTMAWPFGLLTPLTESPLPQGGAAIRFFTPTPGIVQTITGFAELKQHPAVVAAELTLKPGDKINPLNSSPDRPGYLLVRGQNAQQASELADQLMRTVTITVNT